MTATRSATPATAPMSWVMSTIDIPRERFSSASSDRICAWIVTSSAVVGSSAMSNSGRRTTQSRSSPAAASRPTTHADIGASAAPHRSRGPDSTAPTRASAPPRKTRRCVEQWAPQSDRPMRMCGVSEVMGSWNTMPIRAPRMRSNSGCAQCQQVHGAKARPAGCTAVRGQQPSAARKAWLLPAPDSPTTPRHSPGATASDRSRTACTSPSGDAKVTLRCSSEH